MPDSSHVTLLDKGWRRTSGGRYTHPDLNLLSTDRFAKLVTEAQAVEWQEQWDAQDAIIAEATQVVQ